MAAPPDKVGKVHRIADKLGRLLEVVSSAWGLLEIGGIPKSPWLSIFKWSSMTWMILGVPPFSESFIFIRVIRKLSMNVGDSYPMISPLYHHF